MERSRKDKGGEGGREEKQLLASRIINSLPVVRSVWGYGVERYNSAKEMPLFQPSIDAAEALAQPFVNKYKAIDGFASNAIDAVSSVGVVQAAAYPIGYAYGLALGTMNLVENNVQGTRLERPVEMLYDVAGAIVDGVMPAPKGEKKSTDRSLRSRNPVRKIGKRASLQSIRGIPSNSIKFALATTKKYTRMAAFKSLDFGVVFMWNRATTPYRMAERCASYLWQYSFIRSAIERPLPLLKSLSDNFAWSRRVRHDSGAVISFVIGTLLAQLDFLHSIQNLPKTSEQIEKISLALYNIQEFLDSAKKRKMSTYEDEDHLQKRSRLNMSNNVFPLIEKAQSFVTPVVEKVQDFVAPVVEKAPQALSGSGQTPIVNVKDAKTAAINPFAALMKNTEMTDDVAEVHTTHHHAHHAHKHTENKEQPKEETQDDDLYARVADRAKHELEMWKQQEIQQKQDRARHLSEKHARERAELHEQERKAKEQEKKAKEDKLNATIKERAEEKEKAKLAAKEAQEKKENELLEKELAHLQAHQKYEAEKAARDAVFAEKHREEEYARKKAEVQRAVKQALAEREREWRAEHAEEIKAKEIGDALVEEEKREKEAEEKKHEKEVAIAAKKEEAKEKAREAKEAAKEKTVKPVVEKVEEEVPSSEQEVVLVGGHKVTDEVTHWSVETADDGAWETVSHKKATHLAAEPILHPAPLKDAEGATPEKSNEFLALKNAQGEVSSL